MRKLRITVDGRVYNVLVEELSESVEAPERTAPVRESPHMPAQVAAPPPSAAGPGSIVAPLGGVVESIAVAPGHVVAVGDEVAIIEAMKMKNVVRSTVAGKVTSVAAKVNQSVETGQVLLVVA
jgi:glutaconyl-CoA/methylmalonyl-CoA decarboxylase subunit gamma